MLRTSRDEALTDALTGLGNRRALAAHARRAARRRPTPERPLVLALFDLDGFKQYNDTFGHPAGDTLLVRLGGNLAALPARPRPRVPHGRRRVLRALPRPRRAGRADRPAARPPRCPSTATASRSAARTARSRCRSRPPSTSRRCGSPTSGCTRNKHAGRTSAGRQSKDVLLRALAERDPRPRHACRRRVALAAATAEALGLAQRRGRARPPRQPSCTTSARSRSPTRSSASPVR